jgi:tetratricopeptide (TPR) repeat protein
VTPLCEARTKTEYESDKTKKLLGFRPHDVSSWTKVAQALFKLERYEEALECCDKAMEIQPDFKEAFNTKALILAVLHESKDVTFKHDK